MAWFTDTTTAPKIYVSGSAHKEGVVFSFDVTMAGKERTVTENTFEFHGMTYAAAVAATTTYNAVANTTAVWERMNDANGYKVIVVQRTKTAFA